MDTEGRVFPHRVGDYYKSQCMELTDKNGNLDFEECVGIAEYGKDFVFFVFHNPFSHIFTHFTHFSHILDHRITQSLLW